MTGVFDSGVGGLTVLKELISAFPGEQFVYLGDTAHLPYGPKSKEQIAEYARKAVQFLSDYGVQNVVIACHTASAQVGELIQQEFPKLTVYDMIYPTVQSICKTKRKNIVIIGTRGTVASKIYPRLLKKECGQDLLVTQHACPLFVPLIEEEWLQHKETQLIVDRYIEQVMQKTQKPEVVVLGCTHYPLLKENIKIAFEKNGHTVQIIDPAKELAQNVQVQEMGNAKKNVYFLTDNNQNKTNIAKQMLGRKIEFQRATI